MCTAHREPCYSSITTIGTTFHIQHPSIQTKSTPHPTPQPKNSKLPRHNVPHPTPKHTDKSQHRITHHNPRTLKKKPEGCAEGRSLAPLCGFLTFQYDPTLCGVPQSMWHTQPSFRNTCGYTAGIPQSMCHIRPDLRNLCGIYSRGLRSLCAYYFPIQNLENISLTRSSPSDSPRIRPRLSYASVRSME